MNFNRPSISVWNKSKSAITQLKGKLSLLITIKKSGRVGVCEVSDSMIESKTLQRCIMRRLKYAKFPEVSREVLIELPIVFGGQK